MAKHLSELAPSGVLLRPDLLLGVNLAGGDAVSDRRGVGDRLKLPLLT